jgi:hypothetical protein
VRVLNQARSGKDALITVRGEKSIWEQLQEADHELRVNSLREGRQERLLKEGLTKESFTEKFEEGLENALKQIEFEHRVAPDFKDLQEIQKKIFKDILEPEFCRFRPGFGENSDLFDSLKYAQKECGNVLTVTAHASAAPTPAKNQEKLRKISGFHSALMELKPCNDPTQNSIINRTVALAVLEGQIKHAFTAHELLDLTIDAKAHKSALEHHSEFASAQKIADLVKNVVGQAWNVLDLKHHRKH